MLTKSQIVMQRISDLVYRTAEEPFCYFVAEDADHVADLGDEVTLTIEPGDLLNGG